MKTMLIRVAMVLSLVIIGTGIVNAREGDTLEPITIEAPNLVTWPENLLAEDPDFRVINQRVREARNSGVPLAVRIVDLTMPENELPFQVRQYLREDFSQPLSPEQQQTIAESWVRSEAIETSDEANDGFLLLVLVPEDRTQTQAIWWIGPNALPLNGLTRENIAATQGVMNDQFAQGNMPNGVFLGVSEFSYNIQFGTPERLERSTLQDALHMAMIPMAIITALTGLAIPVLAVVLSRRNSTDAQIRDEISPWEAAALHMGRARAEIPAAMLLRAIQDGHTTPLEDGGLQISTASSNDAIEVLRPFADEDGIVDKATMYEITALTQPVREGIEQRLASIGAMTPDAVRDRCSLLVAIGIAAFMAALTTVPGVVSMSAIGVLGIVIAIAGIACGWWWLAYRRYTTPAGESLLHDWLDAADESERFAFDSAIHQHLLTEPVGGPEVTMQMQLVRRLRGLGSA